jgi:hypothetical protein
VRREQHAPSGPKHAREFSQRRVDVRAPLVDERVEREQARCRSAREWQRSHVRDDGRVEPSPRSSRHLDADVSVDDAAVGSYICADLTRSASDFDHRITHGGRKRVEQLAIARFAGQFTEEPCLVLPCDSVVRRAHLVPPHDHILAADRTRRRTHFPAFWDAQRSRPWPRRRSGL